MKMTALTLGAFILTFSRPCPTTALLSRLENLRKTLKAARKTMSVMIDRINNSRI